MAILKTRPDFVDSELGREVRRTLQQMMTDSMYNTESSYNANTAQYPGNSMTFVEKHMNYLNAHPKLDSTMYIANLRLMTRIR